MVELTQIQAGQLLNLFQTVDQGVTVDKQLPGSFGNVQVVLKELVDGQQGFLMLLFLYFLPPFRMPPYRLVQT